MIILVVVAVLYMINKSGYRKSPARSYGNRYHSGYKRDYYKSNASFDLSPTRMTPQPPAPAPATSGYSVNAYRDDNTKNFAALPVASGYKSNAMVNRKSYATKLSGYEMDKSMSGYEAVKPAAMKSSYGYGMAPVNF
jgi:hypothetical protein